MCVCVCVCVCVHVCMHAHVHVCETVLHNSLGIHSAVTILADWCMAVWCAWNVHQDASSFRWHQPHSNELVL